MTTDPMPRDPLTVALAERWHRSRARRLAQGAVALALTLGIGGLAAAQSPSLSEHCRDVTHLGERYAVCSFSPETHAVSLHLRGRDGRPMGSLRELERATGPFAMAMNGGMYRDDLSALGLYVEDGEEHERLVTADGWGNFHLLPNGVFHVSEGENGVQRFGVTETRAFAANPPAGLVHATQSGPMLVIDGKLHPRFKASSRSYKVRNGVGVGEDGRVHFALSHGSVNFHSFAKMFRDHLRTPNALFLDGTISSMRAKGFTRGGFWAPVGPIIVVEEPTPAMPKARPKS